MFIFSFAFLLLLLQGNAEATFEAQACLHSTFNRIFRSSEGNWLIPAMIVICKNTNRISTQAYEKNSNQAKFDQATTNVRDSFSFTINDRVEYHSGSPFDTHGSKKSGVLAIGVLNVEFPLFLLL